MIKEDLILELKDLIFDGKERGYLTRADILDALPGDVSDDPKKYEEMMNNPYNSNKCHWSLPRDRPFLANKKKAKKS